MNSDSWPPLSVRAQRQKESSILVGTHAVGRGVSGSERAQGPDLQRPGLFEGSKLEFLPPDLEAQRGGLLDPLVYSDM